MSDMATAKTVYENMCATLDEMELNYRKEEEDLVVLLGHRGEDMEHNILMIVSPDQEAIHIYEKIPFSINAERAADIACATCYVNDQILLGKFTYNMEDKLSFEVVQSYSGSIIGSETFKRMLLAVVFTVEEYDDKFMALNKGYIKPDAFKN